MALRVFLSYILLMWLLVLSIKFLPLLMKGQPTQIGNNLNLIFNMKNISIEKICLEKGIKLTENRKLVAKIISQSADHPDVEELFARVSKINKKIKSNIIYIWIMPF